MRCERGRLREISGLALVPTSTPLPDVTAGRAVSNVVRVRYGEDILFLRVGSRVAKR